MKKAILHGVFIAMIVLCILWIGLSTGLMWSRPKQGMLGIAIGVVLMTLLRKIKL